MVQRGENSRDLDTALKYRAFISYSHADEEWATWLHKALERYRVPRVLVGRKTSVGKVPRRVFPIFRDRDELPGAASLADKITEALAQAQLLIVICSPKSAASRYVSEEIKTFKRVRHPDNVLCLIVDGEPGASEKADSGQLEALPAAVRYQLGPDGELTDRPAEPLAADARKDKDGKRNAKLKLLAGILGVGYDELKQREKHRRRWRAVQLSVLSLFVGGIIGAVWWNRQQVAHEQRLIGDTRKIAAASLETPDREAAQRLRLALEAVNLTREPYGYVLPEAEIALYRALTKSAMRGAFVETDNSADFGGWTWPVAINTDGSRMLAPSALGPTVMLSADADKVAVLQDPEEPYEHDYVAAFSHDGAHAITGGADGLVRFWTPDGRFVKRIRAHTANVLVVDPSPDGTSLLTVGCDKASGHQSCEARSARLWNDVGEQVAVFVHDEAQLLAAALSPDGTRIVTADESGVLRFWLSSGHFLFEVEEGGHWVARTNFSPDGTQFITGGCHPYLEAGMFSPLSPGYGLCPQHSRYLHRSADPEVRLYDQEGALQATLPGWRGIFASDGAHILTAGEVSNEGGRHRHEIHVWRSDGTPVSSFTMRSNITDIDFTPDGQSIMIADRRGTVTVHNLDGREVNRFGGFLSLTTSFSISNNGNRLATVSCPNSHQGACLERAIHAWDPNGPVLESRRLARAHDPRFHQSPLNRRDAVLQYGPKTRFLFAATNDATRPVVWNTKTGEMVTLATEADRVRDVWFNMEQTRILTNGEKNEKGWLEDQRVQLWDRHGQQLKMLTETYREDIQYMPVAASERLIVVGGTEGTVEFWDWHGESRGRRTGHHTGIGFVDVDPTDDTSVSVDHNGVALIWDVQMNPVTEIDVGSLNTPPERWELSRFDTAYKAIFTINGRGVLIVGPKNMSLWDRQGHKVWDRDVDFHDFTLPQLSKDRVLVVQCTDRGRGVSLGSLRMCYNSKVTLWDLNGKPVAVLDPGTEGETLVSQAKFNRRGNRILTVDENGVAILWDAEGNLVEELPFPVKAADFDPSGRRLATVSGDGIIRLWQILDDVDSMISEAERRLQRYAQDESDDFVE